MLAKSLMNAWLLSRRNLRIASTSAGRVAKSADDIFARENVSFGNTTIHEFIRSMLVLRISSLPGFSDNSEKVLRVTQKCLGKHLFRIVMRATAYGQFVAGDQFDEIKRTAEKLRQCNVIQMLAVSIEDSAGEESRLELEDLYEANAMKLLSCIEISRDTRSPGKESFMQLKLTAILNYNSLVCLIHSLFAFHMPRVSDVWVKFSNLLKKHSPNFSDIADWMQSNCDGDTLRKLLPELSERDAEDVAAGGKRLIRIIDHAVTCAVKVLTDAEYTWINPAIQYFSIALMRMYNKEQPAVFTTHQAYLKETRDLIRVHARECETAGVHFAFKLVRGAYLLSETLKFGSHPPQLCENWNATDINYNNCLRDALRPDAKTSRVLFATHNEESIRLAVRLLNDVGTGTRSKVAFAQLYGMGDYLSYTLGRIGYDVFKSVPYGSVEETLPYLCRRAKENTLFLSGIRKDMEMLKFGLRLKFQNKTRMKTR